MLKIGLMEKVRAEQTLMARELTNQISKERISQGEVTGGSSGLLECFKHVLKEEQAAQLSSGNTSKGRADQTRPCSQCEDLVNHLSFE